MKTAEQWHRIYAAQNYTWLEILKLVQADALRHAASICGDQIPDGYASTCQELIEAEANKLESK